MRITRPIAAVLILALAPMTSAAPLWAQSASEDTTTAMARARFKEGVEFYDKGDFEQARGSFLQAYALKKHPALLLNLAWSCLKSGHALEADRYFRQFLAEGKDITDKQRADANDGLAQSRTRLGRIEIVATAGTEVTVDGERIGTAPMAEPVAVEVGAHTVKFKAPDGTTDTQSITVAGGEKAVARPRASTISPAMPAPAATPTTTPAPIQETLPAGAPAPPVAPKSHAPEAATRVEPAASEAPGTETGGGLFSPPRNVVPVILLGGVAVLGFVGAVVFADFKSQAQSKADDLFNLINANRGTCPPKDAKQAMTFGAACDAWLTDTDQANADATWGNIMLGVGVAATAGAMVYWLVADKHHEVRTTAKPLVVPLVGPNVGGLMISNRF